VVGLLVLTPVLVHDLNRAPGKAVPAVTSEVVGAPLPAPVKARLGRELLKVYTQTPKGKLPDLDPAFDPVRAGTTGSTTAPLKALKKRIDSTIEHVVTRSFRRSLLYSAVFALAAIPLLMLLGARRARPRKLASGAAGRSSA
jgi:hypothetical protein